MATVKKLPTSGKLRAWEIDRKGEIPKVLRGGCKRSLGPGEQRSPKSLLHHPKPHFAPVQKQFWVVPKTFWRPLLPGFQRPLAPSPKHCWEFPLFGQFPRPAASQTYIPKYPSLFKSVGKNLGQNGMLKLTRVANQVADLR